MILFSVIGSIQFMAASFDFHVSSLLNKKKWEIGVYTFRWLAEAIDKIQNNRSTR